MNRAQLFIKRILDSNLADADKIRFVSAWANKHTKAEQRNPNEGLGYGIDDIFAANVMVLENLEELLTKDQPDELITIMTAELICLESPTVWGCMDKLADNYDPNATMDCCCKYTVNPTSNG